MKAKVAPKTSLLTDDQDNLLWKQSQKTMVGYTHNHNVKLDAEEESYNSLSRKDL